MKKHILLCVLGTSPQIVTETMYALMLKKVKIEEIHIITTTEGFKILEENLIDRGILQKFINDFKLKPIKFDKENIYVIADDKKRKIKDIRTILENEIAGEFIFNIVRNLTSQKDTILHCSIAGGRKTMGFYLGSALQIYGRKDDKLYHVLVNEEFEGNPEFFYPPPKPVMINVRKKDGKIVEKSTEEAKIELAELPS